MGLSKNHKRVEIPMTSEQKRALVKEAERWNASLAALVRNILAEAIEDYPDDMPEQGYALNLKTHTKKT